MHFHDYSMQKSLFLGVREGILIKLFIQATIPTVWLRVVYALFGSLALLKIIPLVAPSILSTFVLIDSYHSLKIGLNNRDQTEVSSLKDFSKNSYTFIYFCHHTAIYSFSNSFICFDFGYFFYNKDFFAFSKVFSTSHIARGIIELIADHLFSGGTPGFWDYVINMKYNQPNDVSTLAQRY